MNKLALLCAVMTGVLIAGCETARPSEPIAGADAGKTTTEASAATTAHVPDPSAVGGSSLPASAPYSGAATVQQNVNPGPFLNSSPGGSGNVPAPSASALTSRADGTMSGPSDQPAASTGWGTSAAPGGTTTGTSAKAPTKKK